MSLKEEGEVPGIYVQREKAMWEQSKKTVICEPRREVLGETKSPNTLSSQKSNLQNYKKKNFCCLNHLSVVLCYAARENY